MLQCIAVCCSVLQCVAVCCSVLQCVAVWCSVMQYIAVYCSVLQCVAVLLWNTTFWLRRRASGMFIYDCSVLQCVAVRCSALQCVAVCCSVLQCLAVSYIVLQNCSALQCCSRSLPFDSEDELHVCTYIYITYTYARWVSPHFFQKRPIFLYTFVKRDLQKTPGHVKWDLHKKPKTETYECALSAFSQMWKETYICVKRDLHLCEKRPIKDMRIAHT